MYSPDDTIVAIATPPGPGGIGVVRVSGCGARAVAEAVGEPGRSLKPRYATLMRVRSSAGIIDRAILTFFPAPHSYTGEDVLEISAHGSPLLLRSLVEASMAAGARLAEPGEFTFRAYLRGRIDLVQAEAVQDLVDAVTPLQARAAFDQLEGTLTGRIAEIDAALLSLTARLEASLDFPDEGYHFVPSGGASREIGELVVRIELLLQDAGRGRLIRDGAQVAIVGRPNAGKSSLFNQLVGAGRAIVTEIAGTTRDLLTEVVDIEGFPITLVDTAGLRSTAADAVEAEGIARAHAARRVAALTLVILDRSRQLALDDEDTLAVTDPTRRLLVGNKLDLAPAWEDTAFGGEPILHVSATTGEGMATLRHEIAMRLAGVGASGTVQRDSPAITNVRHVELLTRAKAALERGARAAAEGTPEEFVVSDLNEARALIEEVTGTRNAEDVLHTIFDTFCIGK